MKNFTTVASALAALAILCYASCIAYVVIMIMRVFWGVGQLSQDVQQAHIMVECQTERKILKKYGLPLSDKCIRYFRDTEAK